MNRCGPLIALLTGLVQASTTLCVAEMPSTRPANTQPAAVDLAVDADAGHGIEHASWVTLDDEPSWRDFACLAAIANVTPDDSALNSHAVLTVSPDTKELRPETINFLRFARPAGETMIDTTTT